MSPYDDPHVSAGEIADYLYTQPPKSMAKIRKVLQAQDLVNGVLVRNDKTGGIYRLGPPKKKNVNKNVVNHCQLYHRSGDLAAETWLNLSNLRALGYKLYNQ